MSGVFWIAGGLLEHEARLIAWADRAGASNMPGPASGFAVPGLGKSTAADWDVSGAHHGGALRALHHHLPRRSDPAVRHAPLPSCRFSALIVTVFVTVFVGTVAMWWIYFRFGHERAAHRIEQDETPGSLARQAFTYAHIPILAGIILHAVGSEFMFSHPHEPGRSACVEPRSSAVRRLFLIGNLWFKGATTGRPPLSHLVGLVGLALLLASLRRRSRSTSWAFWRRWCLSSWRSGNSPR